MLNAVFARNAWIFANVGPPSPRAAQGYVHLPLQNGRKLANVEAAVSLSDDRDREDDDPVARTTTFASGPNCKCVQAVRACCRADSPNFFTWELCEFQNRNALLNGEIRRPSANICTEGCARCVGDLAAPRAT